MKTKFTFILLFLFSIVGFSQNDAKRIQSFNLEKKVAIQGYDPVTYFTKKEAVKGNANFKYVYKGIEYHFSSDENKKIFEKNPDNYEPQYGGWCAYAIGKTAEKVTINPKTFKIIDNKLYLFYNANLTNTLKLWNKDEENLYKKANQNWEKINK